MALMSNTKLPSANCGGETSGCAKVPNFNVVGRFTAPAGTSISTDCPASSPSSASTVALTGEPGSIFTVAITEGGSVGVAVGVAVPGTVVGVAVAGVPVGVAVIVPGPAVGVVVGAGGTVGVAVAELASVNWIFLPVTSVSISAK